MRCAHHRVRASLAQRFYLLTALPCAASLYLVTIMYGGRTHWRRCMTTTTAAIPQAPPSMRKGARAQPTPLLSRENKAWKLRNPCASIALPCAEGRRSLMRRTDWLPAYVERA